MLRKIPAACDFSFTATWLAGRSPAFRSTVPEMIPSVRSEVEACAFAVGAHANAAMVTKRLGRNPAARHNFFMFCNLLSISTCCALLGRSLRRLGGWWSQFVRPRTATSNSHFGLRLWSRQRALHHFPWYQPSRARTYALIRALRVPQCPSFHPLSFAPPKNAPAHSCSDSLTPPSSFFSSPCLRSLFLRKFFL